MKNANRMFLIPEDIYKNIIEGFDENKDLHSSGDGTAIGLIKERLQNTSANKEILDPTTRAIRYEQDFKRYNKLLKEKEEKPIDVKLKNFEEIADVVSKNIEHKPPLAINADHIKKPPRKVVVKRKLHKRSVGKVGIRRQYPVQDIKVETAESEVKDKSDEEEDEFLSADTDNEPGPKEQALKYIRQHANELGVLPDGRLARKIGSTDSFITSNIEDLVNHILKNKNKRKRPIPTGYDEFIRRINKHTVLQNLLFPSRTTNKQEGEGGCFKQVFSYKPSLWQ